MTASSSSNPLTTSAQATRLVLVALVSSTLTTIAYTFLAFLDPAQSRQVYALAAVTAILPLTSLFSYFRLVSRQHVNAGVWLMLISAQVVFVASALLISGVGIALGFGIIFLSVLVGGPLLATPNQRAGAIGLGLLAGLIIFFLEFLPLFPTLFSFWPATFTQFSFTLPATPQLGWSMSAAILLISVVYLVLVFFNFQVYSLRAKFIIGFIIIALLPILVLALLSYLTTSTTQEHASEDALARAAGQTASTFDIFFGSVQSEIRSESLLPVWKAYLLLAPAEREGSAAEVSAKQHLQILSTKDSRISSYILLDKNGRVALSNTTLDVGSDRSLADYFLQPTKTGQAYVSTLRFEGQSQTGSIYFSSQIRDDRSNILGVLVARYDGKSTIESLLKSVNETQAADSQAFAVVFDEDFVRIGHSKSLTGTILFQAVIPLKNPDQATAARLLMLQNEKNVLPDLDLNKLFLADPVLYQGLQQAFANKNAVFKTEEVTTGEDTLNQVVTAQLKSQPWVVGFFQPEEVFLQPVRVQTALTIGVVIVMSFVVAGLGLLMTQLLTTPISRLRDTAEEVAKGNLAVRAEVVTQDEIGTLATTFNSMTERITELVGTLEERVAARTAQLQAAAEIGRVVASVRNLDDLLPLALDLIRNRFGYYHASIFLMDEAGRTAILRESTGEVGAMLKARGHKLSVGSNSLIGYATQNRRPRVAREVAEDANHFKNPLLPDTRSEIAIPLIFGDRLLGALDVQSTSPDAFDENSMQVLQTVADLLSVAIENASLFQRTQANLAEVSALYQRTTSASWRAMLGNQKQEMVYDLAPEASTTGSSAQTVWSLAVRLRDQVVGSIELHGPQAQLWDGEEQNVLNNVANQLSTALESAALLEESQRRRQREQVVNDITSQMRSTLNPTTVLEQGVRGLGRVLGATEIVVRLNPQARTAGTKEAEG